MEYSTPKGMRDYLPEKMLLREWAVEAIRDVFRRYGYKPMNTPAIEATEVLQKKCGEEIEGQIFKIDDGSLGLRFDLTVPLARAASSLNFPRPFKRYCIGNVWRREEPQRGRLREFLQADIDIIGSPSMAAEAELLACAAECIRVLGFRKCKIILNNRKILNGILREIGIPKEKEVSVFRSLDKIPKIGEAEVRKELALKGISKAEMRRLFEFFKGKKTNEEKLRAVEGLAKEGAKELREILEFAKPYNLEIEIDLSLVRGLDYYTGPIFEIALSKEIGSVAGGGRYDNLLGLYGQNDYATGISLGIERIIYLLEQKRKEEKGITQIFVAPVKSEFYPSAVEAAQKLRGMGICAETELSGRNLRRQLEYLNASRIPFAVLIGEKEVRAGKVTLRNMKTGEEKFLSLSEAARYVKSL